MPPPLHVQRLQALAQICRRLGGQLRLVSKNEFFTLLAANNDVKMPHTAGSLPEYATHWERKIVYAIHGTKHVGYLIHEIGHVFADRHHPDSDKCDEPAASTLGLCGLSKTATTAWAMEPPKALVKTRTGVSSQPKSRL